MHRDLKFAEINKPEKSNMAQMGFLREGVQAQQDWIKENKTQLGAKWVRETDPAKVPHGPICVQVMGQGTRRENLVWGRSTMGERGFENESHPPSENANQESQNTQEGDERRVRNLRIKMVSLGHNIGG